MRFRSRCTSNSPEIEPEVLPRLLARSSSIGASRISWWNLSAVASCKRNQRLVALSTQMSTRIAIAENRSRAIVLYVCGGIPAAFTEF